MADREFEKRIRERLGNYKEEPDRTLWGGVVDKLAVGSTVFFNKYKPVTYGSIAGSVLVALLIYLLLYRPSLPGSENNLSKETASAGQPATTKLPNKHPDSSKKIKSGQKNHTTEVFKSEEVSTQKTPQNDAWVSEGEDSKMSSKIYQTRTRLVGFPYVKNDMSLLKRKVKKVKTPRSETQEQASREKKKKNRSRMLKFYIYGMPMFSYNRVEANQKDDIEVLRIETTPAFSSKRLGFRLESGFSYQMSKKVSLFSGLLYYQKNQVIHYYVNKVQSVETVVIEDREAVLVPTGEEVEEIYRNDIKNLGVQLGIMYQTSADRFFHTLGTGVEFQKPINGAQSPLSKFDSPGLYTFYNLFYRVEYPENGRFRVLAQPTFNYAFGINKKLNAPFYVKPYGFGLNFGVTFKFY